MKKFTEFLKRHSLVIGISLMFLLTWPIDLSISGVLPIQFPFVVYIFLEVAVAIIIFVTGPERLSRTAPKQIQN